MDAPSVIHDDVPSPCSSSARLRVATAHSTRPFLSNWRLRVSRMPLHTINYAPSTPSTRLCAPVQVLQHLQLLTLSLSLSLSIVPLSLSLSLSRPLSRLRASVYVCVRACVCVLCVCVRAHVHACMDACIMLFSQLLTSRLQVQVTLIACIMPRSSIHYLRVASCRQSTIHTYIHTCTYMIHTCHIPKNLQ